MESQGIIQNRSFRTFLTVLSIAFTIFLIFVLFPFQGERIALVGKDFANIIFSLTAFWYFYTAWLTSDIHDVSKRIWGLFAAGVLLWAVAELIWGYYEVFLEIDVPYPSLADLLWIPGYLPFFGGLILRYRMFNVKLDTRQVFSLIIVIVLFLLATIYFVIQPIVAYFDPERLGESLLNVFYPLGDLFLFILSALILFSFEKGRFAVTWLFISLGFIIVSVSDLTFSYASWNEVYYPEGNLNFVSFFVDVTYALSYLLLALGIYAYLVLLKAKHAITITPISLEEDKKSSILIITRADSRVITFSENLQLLVGRKDKSQIENAPLAQALQADPASVDHAMQMAAKEGSICNYPLKMNDESLPAVFLTALALINPQNEYTGAGIVLRADLSSLNQFEPPLSQEQKGLAESFLAKAGANLKEESRVLRYYFLEQIRLLFSLVYELNGQSVADMILETITQKSRENEWKISIENGQISISAEYEGKTLADTISRLLQDVKTAASRIISPSLVDNEMEVVDQVVGPEVLKIIDRYGVRSAA